MVKKAPDHPTRSLLNVMGEFNFQSPKPDSKGEGGWKGFRELTEK
jgi:hypothetical protein